MGAKKKPEAPAHSPLGPSSSERWLNCPGSVRLCAGTPDVSSAYADEGTAAHTLSEWCRVQDKPASAFLGDTIRVDGAAGREFAVDQAMVDGVQAFLDYINEFPADVDLVESRVSYEAWVPGGFGTIDSARIQIAEKWCVLTDLKYGMGVKVFAKENTQLMSYALGILHDYGHLYDIERFQLNVFQPRLDHVDEWVVSAADLLNWAERVLQPGALETAKPEAALAAGSWCQFCRAKALCKTRQQWVFEQTRGEFDDLDGPSEPVLPLADLMTPEELARALTVAPLVKAWCKDIEDRGLSELQKGVVVGDFKLVAGRSRRAWRDEGAVVAALAQLPDFDLNTAYAPRELLGPPGIEKLIGKKHPLMAAHVVKPPGAPVMVPGSDPRPALTVDANFEFADLGLEKEGWE